MPITRSFFAGGALLLMGGLVTVGQDAAYNMPDLTLDGVSAMFSYPWFLNTLMFVAMSLVGIMWRFEVKRDKLLAAQKKRLLDEANKTDDDDTPSDTYDGPAWMTNPWIMLSFSALFDLLGSGISAYALTPAFGVSPSVYQMVNSSIIIFTAIGARIFLKQRPGKEKLVGILLCLVGLCVVAWSSTLIPTDEAVNATSTSVLLGILMCLIGQLIYAGQFIVEEFTLKYMEAPASFVVFVEGIYGFAAMIAVFTPIFIATGIEDDRDALRMLIQNPSLLWPLGVYFVSIALYNAAGQNITKLLSASHRTILESLRGLSVWILALLERMIWKYPYGEELAGWASFWEAAGFVVLVIGSLVYNDVIKLFGKDENVMEKETKEEEEEIIPRV